MTTLDDLSDDQRAVLASIVAGKLAWTLITETTEAITSLVGLGLVERWTARGIDAVTLTPWGAWIMGVEIIERVKIVGDEIEEDPVWVEKPAAPRQLRLPRRQHEVRFPWMEVFEDPLPGPEFLVDEESGKPIELFARMFDGEWIGGVRVKIDRRMKGKKKARGGPKGRRKAG